MRPTTIREIDQAGHDLRLWCFACARGDTVDGIWWRRFEERGWAMELDQARCRFRCKACRSSDDVLILPATRQKRDINNAPTDVVAMFFHTQRAAAKRRRRGD